MKTIFNPSVNTIFFDMDGVLADFDGFVFENLGRTFNNDESDAEMWQFLISTPHMYFNLKPTPYAFILWETAKLLGAKMEILTAIPRRYVIEESEQDKIDWIHKYISEDVKVNIGPYSADKWKYAKPGDVLIDDRSSNIHDWVNASGIGILHDYYDHTKTLEALLSLKS